MTKTFRNKYDINIVQETSCEFLFPMFDAVKNVHFHSFYISMYASQLWCSFKESIHADIRCEL